MGVEIERKFLVVSDRWRGHHSGVLYRQGYIPTIDQRTVRIRIAGEQGYLTLKGPAEGLIRPEFEYPIPLQDAEAMLMAFCAPPLIEKRRYHIPIGDLLWEIDEFLGANAGLVLAEVELTHPDQAIALPDWIGTEVTDDSRYYNASLVRAPFSRWGQNASPAAQDLSDQE